MKPQRLSGRGFGEGSGRVRGTKPRVRGGFGEGSGHEASVRGGFGEGSGREASGSGRDADTAIFLATNKTYLKCKKHKNYIKSNNIYKTQ